ncbi:DUF397 domain-containing protein [Streptomyces sp. MMS24-I2-30]|uniref:DUF397 domain-containing protein n=1 Tax=Streptomyces sp. MMS24-I2-30 TaxID=3351564 RepID=UPI0038968E79
MPAAPQPVPVLRWFKSSYSGGNATECVEAAFVSTGVLIRDSKAADGPLLDLPDPVWRAFTWALRRRELGC